MAGVPGQSALGSNTLDSSAQNSLISTTSETPLNDNDRQTTEENATYFLLDINEDDQPDRSDHGSRRSRSIRSVCSTSSSSSRSSASAQVVIDHGGSLPRGMEKKIAGRMFRSGDEESESDYVYSFAATESQGSRSAASPRDVRSPPPLSGLNAQRKMSSEIEYDDRSVSSSVSGTSQGRKSNALEGFTEEGQDLAEEMPRWNQQPTDSETEDVEINPVAGRDQRKNRKRINRIFQPDLHSHSWSRRESLQNTQSLGLTSDEALQKLLATARQILDEERARIASTIKITDWALQPWCVAGWVCGLCLIVFFIVGYLKSNPYQFRVTNALVEGLLILVMVFWNVFLYRREQRLTYYEMTERAASIIDALERNGMNVAQDTRIPFVPSVSVARVVRDGMVRVFPVNLLVDGDVVEMLYGDVAPGRMKYIQKPPINNDDHVSSEHTSIVSSSESNCSRSGPPLHSREYYLAKDQIFKPSFFGIPPPSGLMEEYLRARGRHQFVLLETPLEKSMRQALRQKRPNTVVGNEVLILKRAFFQYLIWMVFGVALLINLLRIGLHDVLVNGFVIDQIAELVLALPAYAMLPLLPLALPTLWLIARSFGNAQLLILFEALQISKTEYEDDDEVDEFDLEAPPPTKDVELSPKVVWDRFVSLLTKGDRLSLTRSTNLLESLGNTTVICSLDREGTIANPFPTVEQLMFPVDQDIKVLDVAEDSDEPYGIKFEDRDWEQYLSSLKPVGLNFMLNTNCGVLQGRKRSEYHRRRSRLHVYGRTSPARQTCLCRLGKCIGFREEALQSFALRAEIYTFAPYHDLLTGPRYQYNQHYQYEVPNALSTVFQENTSESYQLLTDGHPALVLDKCTDYWDGKALQTMSEGMEKKIKDVFINATVHDMQCIAFAYRPINTPNGEHIPFLEPSNTQGGDTGCAFVVLPYKPPSSESSSSVSSKSSLSSIPSITVTGAPLSLENGPSQENGHSPAPLLSNKQLGSADSDSVTSEYTSDYSFEEDGPVDEQEEAMFYKEVVKGQIFLGMAAMCHQPKQNVVDFIEDLGLAGIRFVNFSATAERESKAFAERLGLETDWNSCILLSSPDDDSYGNGYLQSHDIKAQLPCGIDEVRRHLEEVDDIPLHVSLFAECTPHAIREMISIFQEYGEVVCCIGNALNAKNTESFALADMSIAMEPMHTRAQSKGRLSLSGKQSPFAMGASLVSLPCGLFMQYETSLYAVTQLIRDARRLLSCIRMGFVFYVGVCLSMAFMQLLSFCMLLPPILTGYQILWVLWIILPMISLSMLFTPHDDSIMLLMPVKNIDHLTSRKRFSVYFVLRFLPLILMSLVIYILTLIYVLDIKASEAFGHLGSKGWLHWSLQQQWAIMYAQNFMLLSFVWCIAWMSPSFLHRTFSLWHSNPFKNKIWVGAFFASIAFQFCFCAVSLSKGPFSLSQVHWVVYFLGFVWPVLLLPLQELVKIHDSKEFTRFQKRSKLEFSTKLGMHSPL